MHNSREGGLPGMQHVCFTVATSTIKGVPVNQGHAELCGSARWAEFIASEVLPAALAGQAARVDII